MTRGVQMMIRECSEAAQKGTCLRMLWGCQWELGICLEEAQRILKRWSDDSSGDSETAQRKPKDYPEDDHSRPKDYPEDAQIRPKDYEEDAERMTEVTQRMIRDSTEDVRNGCSEDAHLAPGASGRKASSSSTLSPPSELTILADLGNEKEFWALRFYISCF